MTALAAIKNETAVTSRKPAGETPIVFLSSGDVPRAFKMIAKEDGIDILDVDNGMTICANLFRGSPANQAVAKMFLPNLGWGEFSHYLRQQKEYKGGVPDIDSGAKTPLPGNADLQIAAGVRSAVFQDIRSKDIIEDDRDASLPYRFPAMDRSGAITEILSHSTFLSRGEGRSRFSWDVRMNHAWDRSGHQVSRNGEETDPAHDREWMKEAAVGGDTFMEACEQALADHLADEDLDVVGSHGGFVVLSEYAGQDMSFASLDEAHAKVSGLDNQDLLMLWAKFRMLDVDLGLEARTQAVQEVMNHKRAEFEEKMGDPEEIDPEMF